MSSEIGGSVINAGDISGTSVVIIGTPIVTVSGNQVFISGQPVYLVSGNNSVQNSGQAIRISGQTVIAEISGQTIVVPSTSVSGNAIRTSGQVAYLVSGQNPVQLYAYDPSGQTLNPLIVNQSGGNILRVDAGSIQVSANVSGNAVRISGQTVYFASGQNGVGLYAFDPSGQTLNEVWVGQSGGHAIQIAGSISASANISGQTVYLVSGQNNAQISGQRVRIEAFDVSGGAWEDVNVAEVSRDNQSINFFGLATYSQLYGYVEGEDTNSRLRITASGQGISGIPHRLVVALSGDPVSISGQVVRNSGQSVRLTSGQNPVQLYALDPSGQTLNPLIVSASGSNILRVDAGSINVSANVSGNVVYLTSGQNNVQISGQTVLALVSGQLVAVSGLVATSVSGNAVRVSGEIVRISGQIVGLYDNPDGVRAFAFSTDDFSDSDTSLMTVALLGGYDQVTDQFKRVRVTASGQGVSGVDHKLVVTFSGDRVLASVSGNMVSISGQPVSVSGNMISISGQPAKVSGETVSVSGIVQERVPVQIRTRDTLLITGASGGVALLSGDVLRVTVKNVGISGTVMYVGGSGDYPWVSSGQTIFPFFSGRGFAIRDGEGVTIHTSNMAFVRVVSHTSGQYVSYIGEQY